MKKISYSIFITFFMLTACNNETISKAQEIKSLQEQFEDITNIVEDIDCIDSIDWTFTSYGSKACGGPQGFIAYPSTIDTEAFLDKLEVYRIAEEQFNTKWGVVSDCAVIQSPSHVTCENGKPMLVYGS